MKRTIFVSALVLALMVALCGEAFSRSTPWGYSNPGEGGDDHTWGGDFQAGSENPGGVFEGISDRWTPTNMIITTLLFKWLRFGEIGNKSGDEVNDYIRNETQDTEPTIPVTTDTGGLQ